MKYMFYKKNLKIKKFTCYYKIILLMAQIIVCVTRRGKSRYGATSDSKPKCPYGSECYRQNPQHFLEVSHPDGRTGATRAIKMCHPPGRTASNSSPSHRGKMYDHRNKVAQCNIHCNSGDGSACPDPNCPYLHEWQKCKYGTRCNYIRNPRSKKYCWGTH